MSVRSRIIFACGLAELLTCGLLIEQHLAPADRTTLVLYGRRVSMPLLHCKETLEYANWFVETDRVIDLVDASDAIANGEAVQAPADLLAAYAELFADADEIMMHTLWKAPETTFLKMCANASIILFDNGLESHAPRRSVPDDTPEATVGLRGRDRERITLACYSVGDYLPPPAFVDGVRTLTPDAAAMKAHLEAVGARGPLRLLDETLPKAEGKAALLFGTSFFRTDRVTLEDEARVYAKAADAFGKDGLLVIMKEHPRAPQAICYGNAFPIHTSLPVEFIPEIRPVAITASISSTALLTVRKLFGAPYRLLGDEIARAMRLWWIDDLKRYASS